MILPEVASAIGRIADNVPVRKLLSQIQRDWTAGRRVVTEDRFLSGGSLAHSGKEAEIK